MIAAIADTHAAIWYLSSDPRLGRAASEFIDAAISRRDHIGVSAITLAEMVYLVEKARIPSSALNELHAALADTKSVLSHVALDEAVAMKMRDVSHEDIPDLPDRVIAATARLRHTCVEPRWPYPVINNRYDLVGRADRSRMSSLRPKRSSSRPR